jgi:hypothetical protein
MFELIYFDIISWSYNEMILRVVGIVGITTNIIKNVIRFTT